MNTRHVLLFTRWQSLYRVAFIQEDYQLYKISSLIGFRARSLGDERVLKSHRIASLDGYENTLERYCVFNVFDVTMVNLLPISCISSVAWAFYGPPVSIATGKNKCVPHNFSYFAVMLTAAIIIIIIIIINNNKIIIILFLFIYYYYFYYYFYYY